MIYPQGPLKYKEYIEEREAMMAEIAKAREESKNNKNKANEDKIKAKEKFMKEFEK